MTSAGRGRLGSRRSGPPKAPTRPEWLDPSLYPFEHRWLDVEGSRVHYVDEGEGPVLLMLHGNPTWSFVYRDVIRGLRDRFRCIAVDYPGFGLSHARPGYGFTPREHADTLERLLLALDLTDVTLFAHDWGGPIGLDVAIRRRERFGALVLGNTWAWRLNGDLRAQFFSRWMGGLPGRFAIRRLNAFVEVILPLLQKRRPPHRVMQAYRGPFPTPDSREPTWVLPRELLGSRALLAEVESGLVLLRDLPVLFLWGARDLAFTLAYLRRLEEHFPNHHSVLLDHAWHYIQEDEPERIATEISLWWPRRTTDMPGAA